MHSIELSDATEQKSTETHTITDPTELKRWWLERKDGPFTMWNLSATTFGASFGLGNGEGAGLMVGDPEFEGPMSFLHEGSGTEHLEVRWNGYDDELNASSRVSAERMLEVLTYLMEHGEIGPGKWDTDGKTTDTRDGGAPTTATKPARVPEPRGQYSKALIQLIRGKSKRSRVLDDVLALVRKAQDDDFKAYLAAFAQHEAYTIECGDWMIDPPEIWDNGDICIGRSGGGDPYLMRGRKSVVLSHETSEEETYSGFEGLLGELVFIAHDNGHATDLDAITGEEPQ